jgi:hypothetical protein
VDANDARGARRDSVGGVRIAALIAVGLLIAVGALWLAAEQHYDNCVAAAKATTPSVSWLDENDSLLDEPGEAQRRRREAVEGCSRLPW